MVQWWNSQAFLKRLTRIKKSLHTSILRSNTMLEAALCKTTELRKDPKEDERSRSLRQHRRHTHSSYRIGKRDTHTPPEIHWPKKREKKKNKPSSNHRRRTLCLFAY